MLGLLTLKGWTMNLNLALPWGDGNSPPQTPYLAFSSPQSDTLLFTDGASIRIDCQAGLRSVALRWTLHRNAIQKPFRQGVAEALPGDRFRITVDTAGLYPGFYDLRVELDTGVTNAEKTPLAKRPVRGVCTFGWKAAAMAAANTRPADFANFWADAKAKLARVPLDPHESPLTPFGPKEIDDYNLTGACLPPDYDPAGHKVETVESGKVDFAGPDGGRVYGWLAKPQGKGPFPAMLVLPGAGFNARPRPLEHARHGYVALDIQVHGQDVDLKEYPKLPGYYEDWQYDPVSAYYYYNVHLRCLQAVNYLASRPDVDPNRIVVVGGSQGGRLSFVVAGLDPRIKAAVPCIANAGNQPHLRWVARCNGYKNPGDKRPDPSIPLNDGMGVAGAPPLYGEAQDACFAYYDPLNYAQDIHCPVLINAGLIDPVSPPYSIWPIYARLQGWKEIVAVPGHGHDWSADFDRRAWRWLEGVLAGNLQPAIVEAKPLRVLFLGDSITGWSDLAHYLKFSHIVERMIAARGVPVTVVNKGIGGDTTDGVLKRLETDALALKPDICVLLIGGNDAASKAPDVPMRFARNYDAILTKLQGAGVKVLALQYHMLPDPQHPEKAWAHLDDHNPLIAKIADEHNAPVLDMAAPMREAAKTQKLEELVSLNDGVHLNPGGELVFADAIFAKLVNLGWLR
jgi:cephalosporin-C deacetylase-like acetyl esterase/lysophospholipase L1-like esterase